MKSIRFPFVRPLALGVAILTTAAGAPVEPKTPASLFPLTAVRLLPGPFSEAAAANRKYLLAHDPDRLLAPFFREAGLQPKKPPYPNWESMGLDGHTAGHYLSALSDMIAAGDDPDGALGKRLDYMLSEMEKVQAANGDGYIGGVPGSRQLWKSVAAGDVGEVGKRWVPWYNVHKTFAGLRDAALNAGRPKARVMLLNLGDWCLATISNISEAKMQEMLGNEHGGMNESLADIHAITGERKYLDAARRFNHRALLDPLARGEDRLTGMHANTQVPKVVGFSRIANLSGDRDVDSAARFFWKNVTSRRSVAFGGNSVSEHFNDPADYRKMLEHREGPENCNTYNMLRLTESLFVSKPEAGYADFYERALFNHILSSINPHDPGYVYFTPIRPQHYRVYSTPEECFWCCVGTGMENPGLYGRFIYARDADGVFVNLFIPSELKVADGFRIRQETRFPFESSSALRLSLAKPSTFSLRVRHPEWIAAGDMSLRLNGEVLRADSKPGTYAEIRREWKDGDRLEVALPMKISAERLPDGSDWAALLYGPLVLAAPGGPGEMPGLRAEAGRMSHVAGGPMVPMDRVPSLLAPFGSLPDHVAADSAAGPLAFRIKGIVEPAVPDGILLKPFFMVHDTRYQIYWQITTAEDLAKRKEALAAAEKEKAAREAATIDSVTPGEQQSEVEHAFKSEDSKTGLHEGRRWRDGRWFEYSLDTRGEKSAELEITCWGGDTGRKFDITADGELLGTVALDGKNPGRFMDLRFSIPASVLHKAADGRITVRFTAKQWVAGGIFGVRLARPDKPAPGQ